MCKLKVKSDELYVPNKIRSHPFEFINFPFYGVLIFVFFWIVLCPLVSATFFYEDLGMSAAYWFGAFIIFFVIFSMLICKWKCKPKGAMQTFYYVERHGEDPSLINPDDFILEELNCPDLKFNEEKVFPKCSMKKKPPELTFVNVEQHGSQNLSLPLTPREIFFMDLIDESRKHLKTSTAIFIENECRYSDSWSTSGSLASFLENERRFSGNSGPKLWYNENGMKKEIEENSSLVNFFIANVPKDKNCITEVTLYINGEDEDEDESEKVNVAISKGSDTS